VTKGISGYARGLRKACKTKVLFHFVRTLALLASLCRHFWRISFDSSLKFAAEAPIEVPTTNHGGSNDPRSRSTQGIVHNQYKEQPEHLAFALSGAESKADVIAELARERIAAERAKEQHAAHSKARGKHIAIKIDLTHTPDGPASTVTFLGRRMNITTHATTTARGEAREFNGKRDCDRACMNQGGRWMAVSTRDFDRMELWSRLDPGPAAEIPESEIDTMALQRGLTL
jgi:hypothetical protein